MRTTQSITFWPASAHNWRDVDFQYVGLCLEWWCAACDHTLVTNSDESPVLCPHCGERMTIQPWPEF